MTFQMNFQMAFQMTGFIPATTNLDGNNANLWQSYNYNSFKKEGQQIWFPSYG